jgi:hypothetical protein
MTPVRLSVEWHDEPPIVDKSILPIWELRPLPHDEFTEALASGFQKAGDPKFNLHWSGVDLPLSSENDLAYMADDLIDFGRWLCWPRGSHDFSLAVQGFEMVAVATISDSAVDFRAEWGAAYRTPVTSLANQVSVERTALSREVGTILRQIEQMLLTEKLVYVPLSWVCRYLAISEDREDENEGAPRKAR